RLKTTRRKKSKDWLAARIGFEPMVEFRPLSPEFRSYLAGKHHSLKDCPLTEKKFAWTERTAVQAKRTRGLVCVLKLNHEVGGQRKCGPVQRSRPSSGISG